MNIIRMEFENPAGESLIGLLEMPDREEQVKGFALYAHCFTCGKDNPAAVRISRALAARGIAVLRFDFTGLGDSGGDFASSDFSSNIEDLVCAAKALEARYQAPRLLIGHSLGGAAVLAAATRLDSIRAVATIAAPATAAHVVRLFENDSARIREQGRGKVVLSGGEFEIESGFLDDIERHSSTDTIADLDAALLVLHSPLDTIVSIDEAASIYQAALHPKSFISLDDADHLLTRAEDAEYAAALIACWSDRYLVSAAGGRPAEKPEKPEAPEAPETADGEVLITELDRRFQRGMYANGHFVRADEPPAYGGSNLGPTPYDLLLMSLGACTSMTLRMYANRRHMPLEDLQIRLRHERVHAEDCVDCEDGLERITRRISLSGELDAQQREKLLGIADRCPVHRTLQGKLRIVTELVDG